MSLHLQRPLVWLDLETTGLDPVRDRIVEVSVIKEWPDGRLEPRTWRVNPGMAIPPAATALHHIRDDDVCDAPAFAGIAPQLDEILRGSDVAGFGISRFDLLVLTAEFRRAKSAFSVRGRAVVDAQVVFHTREQRNLGAACRFYLDRELTDAHDSRADVAAAREVLLAQLQRYPDLPRDAYALHARLGIRVPDWVDSEGKFRWEDAEVVLAFGRHRGRSLRELAEREPEYLQWVLASDFSAEVKEIVEGALRGRFPPPSEDEGSGTQQSLDLPSGRSPQ